MFTLIHNETTIISEKFVEAGCCNDGLLPFRESCYYFRHSAVHFIEAAVKIIINMIQPSPSIRVIIENKVCN